MRPTSTDHFACRGCGHDYARHFRDSDRVSLKHGDIVLFEPDPSPCAECGCGLMEWPPCWRDDCAESGVVLVRDADGAPRGAACPSHTISLLSRPEARPGAAAPKET